MKKQLIISAVIILALILVDQISKTAILNYYGGREHLEICYETHTSCGIESFTVIPYLISFTFHFNEGGAWGLLFGQMTIFYFITAAAFVLFYFLLKDINFQTKKFYTYAVLLMIGGGIGNFIDRLVHQKVTDFIRFDFISFPIFNFADVFLVVGVILFAIDVLLEDVLKWTKPSQ